MQNSGILMKNERARVSAPPIGNTLGRAHSIQHPVGRAGERPGPCLRLRASSFTESWAVPPKGKTPSFVNGS